MLFRKQAVQSQTTRLYGKVFIATPIKYWLITTFLVSIVALVLGFVATASFARIETVRGVVAPSGGVVNILAPTNGVLTDFDLLEGQALVRGQTVGRITASSTAKSTGTREAARLSRVENAIKQVDAQLEQSTIIADLEIAAQDHRRLELTSRIDQTRELLDLQRMLTAEVQQSWERIKELAERGLTNTEAVSQQNIQFIVARQDVKRLESEIAALMLDLSNTELTQAKVVAQARLRELQLENEKVELLADRQIIAGYEAYDITASASGTATTILASSGHDILGAQQIFSILPDDSTLEVVLYLPSRAVGLVERGQAVRLLYDSFPYQQFGTQSGQISEISNSVIMPGTPGLMLETTAAVFRIKVRLDSETVHAFGRDIPLQPGMLLNANIILEDRTILDWLLEPFYAASGSA